MAKMPSSNLGDVGSIPATPAKERRTTMTRAFVQCRLRRSSVCGGGHAEMVAYLPTHGTNGLAVEPGRLVVIATDSDTRPWSIVSAPGPVVDAAFIERKRSEGRRLSQALR